MTKGIYTLANDVVYDHLIALLNSIEVNCGGQTPVCVIPYDGRMDKVSKEVKRRKNVQIFEDKSSIEKWENFAHKAWSYHPYAFSKWKGMGAEGVYRMGMHRRYCAFDGPFEKFIYMDGDTLAMRPFDDIFEKLDEVDFLTYDYQFKDPSHVYDIKSPLSSSLFSRELMDQKMFCAGFYASKRNLFSVAQCEELLESLKGDAGVLYINGPDQSLLNYMIMKRNIKSINLGKTIPYDKCTGNSVTSPHFKEREHLLYDRGNILTYLHYIGVSSSKIEKLCAGENLNVPYRKVFLHYRYLYEPDKRPVFEGKLIPLERKTFRQKVLGVVRSYRSKILAKT